MLSATLCSLQKHIQHDQPTHLEHSLLFLSVVSHRLLASPKQLAAAQPAVRHGIAARAAAGCCSATAGRRCPAPGKRTSRAKAGGGRAATLAPARPLRGGRVAQPRPTPAAAAIESRRPPTTPRGEAPARPAAGGRRRWRAKAATSAWRGPAATTLLHWVCMAVGLVGRGTGARAQVPADLAGGSGSGSGRRLAAAQLLVQQRADAGDHSGCGARTTGAVGCA